MNLDRSIAPELVEIDTLNLIEPEHRTLKNNIPVLWVNGGTQDVIRINVIVGAGSIHQTKPLQVQATTKLLKEGTQSWNANEIALGLEQYGSFLHTDATRDYIEISLYCVTKFLPNVLPYFYELIAKPIFPANELHIHLGKQRQKHLIDLEKVSTLCRNAFLNNLYGIKHPYGTTSNLMDFEGLTVDHLIEFHQNFFGANNMHIVCSGKINQTNFDLINRYLGSIEKSKLTAEFTLPPINTSSKLTIFKNKEGSVQNNIRIGKLWVDRNHPDYIPLFVLNTVFGGYFGSRLMKNIREDKGYTYGIGCGTISLKYSSYFFISTEVGSKVCNNAVDEIYKEMQILCENEIGEDELNLVKNYLSGSMLKQADGIFDMADLFKNTLINNLDINYYSSYLNKIKAVQPAQLLKLAQKYYQKDSMLEVISGSKSA